MCSVGGCHHRQGWHENQTDSHGVWRTDHHWWAAAGRYRPHHQHNWNTRPDTECTVPTADEVEDQLAVSTLSTRILDKLIRSVAVAGPRAWNNLPVDLCISRTFSTFKTHLKSHLCSTSFPSVWLYHWLFLYGVLEADCAAYASLVSKFVIITLPSTWHPRMVARDYTSCPGMPNISPYALFVKSVLIGRGTDSLVFKGSRVSIGCIVVSRHSTDLMWLPSVHHWTYTSNSSIGKGNQEKNCSKNSCNLPMGKLDLLPTWRHLQSAHQYSIWNDMHSMVA